MDVIYTHTNDVLSYWIRPKGYSAQHIRSGFTLAKHADVLTHQSTNYECELGAVVAKCFYQSDVHYNISFTELFRKNIQLHMYVRYVVLDYWIHATGSVIPCFICSGCLAYSCVSWGLWRLHSSERNQQELFSPRTVHTSLLMFTYSPSVPSNWIAAFCLHDSQVLATHVNVFRNFEITFVL